MIDRRVRPALVRTATAVAVLVGLVGLSGCATAAAPRHLVDSSTTTGSSSSSSTHRSTPSPTPTPVITTSDVAVTSPVPFTSTTVDDGARPQGTSAVTTAGVDGVLTTTYHVTYTDGVETGREQVSQSVTTPPVNQVTAVGTYVAPPPPPVVPGGGATALCADGTYSYAAHHQGACSHHGGVAQFYK